MESDKARGFTYMDTRDIVDVATQREEINDNIRELGMRVTFGIDSV